MTKFALFDAEGFPRAFYSPDVNPEIPEDAVEITEEQWEEFISYPLARRWVDGQVAPYDPPLAPPTVPLAVSPLQARKALRHTGLKALVEGYVANLPEEAREEWEYAPEIRRDHAILNAGWEALGKTQSELDDLFRLAATL